MGRRFFLFLALSLPVLVQGQNAQFKNGFGINQDFLDYNVQLLDNKLTSFDSSLSQSIRVSYSRYLSRTWGFAVGVSNGFLLNQTQENRLVRKSYILGGDIDLIMKLNNGTFFKPDARVAPYLSFGYNFNYLTGFKELGLEPMVISNEYGLGFNVRLGERSSINLGAALNQQLNGDFDTHVQYRLGFAQAIGKKKTEKPEDPTTPKDYDKDGIADADDLCPTLAGIADNEGCPDGWVKAENDSTFKDSLLGRIDEMDQIILSLRTDLEKLRSTHVVEVKYIDTSEKVVQTTYPDVADNNTSDGNGDDNQEDGSTGDSDPGKTKTVEPVITSDPKEGKDETSKVEVVKSETTDKTETGETKTVETKEPAGTNGFDPRTGYKGKNEPKAFYVVAISTKDPIIAEKAAALIAKDYPVVKILPQPNGFYRVGIYATKVRSEALKTLEYAKTHGIPSGWIAFE